MFGVQETKLVERQTFKSRSCWRQMIMLCLVAVACQATGEVTVTRNVIQRTFHIRWNTSIGTAFVIDHGAREYIVTAGHLVKGIQTGNIIDILHDNRWKSLPVMVVGLGDDMVDIAVLACSIRLSPSLPLVASTTDLVYGQSVAFLGYPFGLDSGGEEINRGIPLPFVKSGIVSAMEFGDVSRIFLDAHVNKGFSGGPVVYVPHGQSTDDLRVAGVVKGYRSVLLPIVDRKGEPAMTEEGKPVGFVRHNAGIVETIGIVHALELIEANPVGFPLTVSSR